MTYNLCYVIMPTGKELSGENRYPPPEFRRAYCSNLSGVLLLSVNNIALSIQGLQNRKYIHTNLGNSTGSLALATLDSKMGPKLKKSLDKSSDTSLEKMDIG